VMDFVEGELLGHVLSSRRLGVEDAIDLGVDIVTALSDLHHVKVVHRDLKPDNIFLATNVENPKGSELPYTVKLVDFGIAKMFEAPRVAGLATPPPMGGPTQEGAVIGTPNFMAPEQLTLGGAPGPLTDLWSLGACTFAAMTARIPFEGDVLGDIVIKVCASPLPVPSQLEAGVPAGFDAWFARACSRDPAKRFQSATELAESLANVCGVGRVRMASQDEAKVTYMLKRSLTPLESIPVPPQSMSPKTAMLAGIVLGVTAMIGIAGALAFREKEQSQAAASVQPSASPPTVRNSPLATAGDAGSRDAR